MLVSPAYAQAAGAQGGDLFVSLMPLVLIFIVFYFLLIRPQQQKVKQHKEMIDGIKKGDQVLTAGGIVGKVTKVEADGMLMVEIAQGVVVKVAKATVSDLMNKPVAVPAPANSDQKPDGAQQPFGFITRFFKK